MTSSSRSWARQVRTSSDKLRQPWISRIDEG
nr:MAG TPA: hypothetical protein [Caudoviricetes sp.]